MQIKKTEAERRKEKWWTHPPTILTAFLKTEDHLTTKEKRRWCTARPPTIRTKEDADARGVTLSRVQELTGRPPSVPHLPITLQEPDILASAS